MKPYLRAAVALLGLVGLSVFLGTWTGRVAAQQGPTSGTVTQSSVSCGTGSTTLLAAGTARAFLRVVVPNAAANSVWFNWSGAAAVAAPPSDEIKAGGTIVWEYASGFIPTGLITCIASAATTVTIVYK
jgi:hypothetical protein